MIFEFASHQYWNILSFGDCSKYSIDKDKNKKGNNKIIKNALLQVIDISYQLSQCEKIHLHKKNESDNYIMVMMCQMEAMNVTIL